MNRVKKPTLTLFFLWLSLLAGATHAQTLTGCTQFARGSKTICTKCKEPSYKLQRTKCICAAGYVRSGLNCVRRGPCYNRCGQINLLLPINMGVPCSCDYFCDNIGDCCGGTASKNLMCPSIRPTINKLLLTDCNTTSARISSSDPKSPSASTYKPGMCWCDEHCLDNNDCCPLCTETCKRKVQQGDSSNTTAASTTQETPAAAATAAEQLSNQATAAAAYELPATADTLAAAEIAAQAAAARSTHRHSHDCGDVDAAWEALSNEVTASAAQVQAVARSRMEAEVMMQACQNTDTGPPAEPYIMQLYWTAGQVCSFDAVQNMTVCEGGDYPPELVAEQVDYLNKMYARVGIQFVWDGNIQTAKASQITDIYACLSPSGECWLCKQRRSGDMTAINVVTAPWHIGPSGDTLGVTVTPDYIASGVWPQCSDWVVIYEKTLPNQGGRSKIDDQLVDSGHVLAHEVGHALFLLHTWFSGQQQSTIATQCEYAASLSASDVMARRSDGVRDTPAQSLNGSYDSFNEILRFINCDPETGAYTNTTAFAQRSCTADRGFGFGDAFLNNHNNLMSYGDKTCLRTLTPGQGARARCGLKCMRLNQCTLQP